MTIELGLAALNLLSTALIVPLAASYWRMQERLSKIEGALEIIVRKVT